MASYIVQCFRKAYLTSTWCKGGGGPGDSCRFAAAEYRYNRLPLLHTGVYLARLTGFALHAGSVMLALYSFTGFVIPHYLREVSRLVSKASSSRRCVLPAHHVIGFALSVFTLPACRYRLRVTGFELQVSSWTYEYSLRHFRLLFRVLVCSSVSRNRGGQFRRGRNVRHKTLSSQPRSSLANPAVVT